MKNDKRLSRWMLKAGWNMSRHDNHLRGRLYALASVHSPWWNWGDRLMVLVGQNDCGNWSEPSPTTWWYRRTSPHRMWRTGYPIHRHRDFQIVTDHAEFERLTAGLNKDEMYEWQALNVNQDGELQLGHHYWGGNFYGMRRDEWWLVARYLRRFRRRNLWGLRSWLYALALNASVHRRKPFACHATPPPGSGGYSHWHCTLRRNHDGLHRYNNCVWGEIDGLNLGRIVHHPAREGVAHE